MVAAAQGDHQPDGEAYAGILKNQLCNLLVTGDAYLNYLPCPQLAYYPTVQSWKDKPKQ
jgi:hypothetical protein